ncbi:MAG: peptidase modulator of gyrase, partial [Acidimicrobiaceae bacterium]|nr:peptidase modulator of gyrase [Acidimicrobiaceae bacterium]
MSGDGRGIAERGRLAGAEEVVERALGAARGPCIVIVTEGSSAEVRFANNVTTTNGTRRDRRVSVICFSGEGEGASSGVASASGAVEVEDLVRAADADARGAGPAEDASELLGGDADADFGEPLETTSLGVLSGVLGQLGEAFARARSEDHVLAGFATHEVSTTYFASST